MSQTKAQLVGGVGFSTADSLTVHNGLAVTGVVTATSFAGDITGNITGNATGLTGSPSIVVTDITASGNITIGGTLTYDDVTNVDSIGIVTARSGVHFGLAGVGGSVSGAGNANFAGIVTATSFSGDGSNLSNTGSTLSEPSTGTQRIVTTSLTTGTMTSSGTGAELAFDYANNHLEFSDNTKATFGSSNYFHLYHDGSNSLVENYNGGLFIDEHANDGDINLRSDDGSGGLAYYVVCDGSAGSVILYHYGSVKFETKSDGVDITGEVQCDSLDVDGVADITGNVTLHANLDLQDSDKILLGTDDDLEIYHDGSNSYISEGGTGVLKISSNRTEILSGSSETCAQFQGDGAVTLYYDNSAKFATKTDGIDVTGEVQCDSLDVDGAADITGDVTTGQFDITNTGVNGIRALASGKLQIQRQSNAATDARFEILQGTTVTTSITGDGNVTFTGNVDLQDDDRLRLGAGDDIQIYHSSGQSYIQNDTGNLRIDADALRLRSKTGSESYIVADVNGAVELYYDNSKKLETTGGGITVTGVATATSFSGDGSNLTNVPAGFSAINFVLS